MRYLIRIKFVIEDIFPSITWDIFEPIETLEEALSYEFLIDDTVYQGDVIDIITGDIVKSFK